jgi:hypothetical protein
MLRNRTPILRTGFACRALKARNPIAPLANRRMGTSPAAGMAMLICLFLAFAIPLYAQISPEAGSQSGDKYRLGYEAGYQAGLRAAQEKLTASRPPAGPPATSKDSPISSGPNSTRSNAASQVNALWDDMLNHDGDDEDTVFHHSQTSPFWLSGQVLT